MALHIGYLGGHPLHGQESRGLSGPGDKTADGKAPVEDTRDEVDINIDGDVTEGGRFFENGGINQAAPEQVCTVYCYAITVRPM